MSGRVFPFAFILLSALLISCIDRSRIPYDMKAAQLAEVPGFANVRTYLDTPSTRLADIFDWHGRSEHQKIDYLMISGGGAGGAFTVGALSAWTETGRRPSFDIVSGVSTGALIAPFAFLGSDYDPLLIKLYTSGVANELVDHRYMPNKILGESLLCGVHLRSMVEKYATAAVIKAIAIEYRKGRRLFLMTSNLDSQKAVVWNMGAIAASGRPDSIKLFQDILVASASIPGIFPAVRIKVEAEGRTFEELHSDGGASSQILTIPFIAQTAAKRVQNPRKSPFNIYALVNNALMPEFSTSSSSTLSVISRSYAMMVKAQTRDALIGLYGYAQRSGAVLHVASIDKQVPFDSTDPFNQAYMDTVFLLGRRHVLEGSLWKDNPVALLQSVPSVGTDAISYDDTTMHGPIKR